MPPITYTPLREQSNYFFRSISITTFIIALLFVLGFPTWAYASDAPGKLELPYWSALPFVLLLGCIAMLPLIREHWWHANRNKAMVSLGLALPVVIYLLAIDGATKGESTHQLLHELAEYASFIIMLTALYTISGGILITGDIPATPRTNTLFLAIGAVLANIIGTTGASMILIRPLLRINHARRHKIHLPIFFIFIVSNTGGLLTPLGDPPLFLGFLQGVDFFWTLRLWREWLFVNATLLAIFYCWDRVAYRKEPPTALQHDAAVRHPLRISGFAVNGALLVALLMVVILHSPAVGAGVGNAFGIGNVTLHAPIGQISLIGLIVLSLRFTKASVRRGNHFSWGPIVEVAVLFVGIFATMVPALALLRQHGGALNVTQPWQFFWMTGMLSGFLDNAPTYLTFATLGSGKHDLVWLSANAPRVLAAISCGAVFMGALTYIGNGPNFMVKAIAEEQGYKMPSFFGYVKYSFAILLPLMAAVTLLFFV